MAGRGPVATHAMAKSVVKGEDVLLVDPRISYPAYLGEHCEDSASRYVRRSLDSAQESEPDLPPRDTGVDKLSLQRAAREVPTYGLYCVFDGHNGVGAAAHACEELAQAIHDRMPGAPPPESDHKRHRVWREKLQRTLVDAFGCVHESFACHGQPAGCTATVILQCGWILTIANLGDSRALIDTGTSVSQVTVDHRVATHAGERSRLEAAKILIAPIDSSGEGPAAGPNAHGYGPLRMWPGGLCLSRALGDFDVGASVLCIPHIQQVKLPSSGARLLVASDGVWDAFDSMPRVGQMCRPWSTQNVPTKVIQAIRRAYGGLRDDTSIVCVDFMPDTSSSFSDVCGKGRKQKSNGSGGGSMGCFCMARPQAAEEGEEASTQPQPAGKLEVLADTDIAGLAGLLPSHKPSAIPGWYTELMGEDMRELQTAAVEAWLQVRKIRTTSGKVPSRDDLAGYFARAHKSERMTQQDAVQQQDVQQDRQHPLDYTVKFGNSPGQLAAPVHKAKLAKAEEKARGRPEEGASSRFKDSISSIDSYGKHFGHYAGRSSVDLENQPSTDSSGSVSASETSNATPRRSCSLDAKRELPSVAEGVRSDSADLESVRKSLAKSNSLKECPKDAREHRVKFGRNTLMQEPQRAA